MTVSALPIFVATKILGGLGTDRSNSIQVSQDGSVYLAGEASASFDSQVFAGGWDGFLSKYSEDGTKLWTKFLGGSGSEFIRCISIGTSGSVYAAGYTDGSFQGESNLGSYDAFLTKYLETGEIAWTKFIGSSQSDLAYSVFSDANESVYTAGPSNGSFDGNVNSGGADGFLSKYDENGTKIWSTFIGGVGDETPRSLTGDSDGNIYLVGYTTGSLDVNTNSGNRDSFITKVSSSGEKIWTKCFGGAGDDDAIGVAIGFDGSLYVVGGTRSDFDSQINNGDYDAFLTKYSADGELIWTRFVGGTGREIAQSLTISADESIIISGEASSSFGGQVNSGGTDSFVSKIGEDGTIIWTKFIGTNPDEDLGTSSVTASNGSIYISGYSNGSFAGAPTTGGTDSYITQFLDSLSSDNASDDLVGGAYNDLLIGNGGDDTLKGGSGSDTLEGGEGNDTADYSDKSSAVSIVLNGTTLVTVNVNDVAEDSIKDIENIIGGSGNDSLTGDNADNKLEGKSGNDTLKGGNGDDVLDGGDDLDTADYSDKTTAVVATLNGSTSITVTVNSVAEDSIKNIENLIGGSGNDSLTGDSHNNKLDGGAGDDSLKGANGTDTLNGGEGTDTADYSDSETSVVVTLIGSTAATVTVNNVAEDSIKNIENLIGGSGNDSLTGDVEDNKLDGGAGKDNLKGAEGVDALDGGDGNDSADYSDKTTAVVATLNGSTSATVSINGVAEDTIKNIENPIGGSGNDSFTGDGLSNTFVGGAGKDTLNGGNGVDIADYSEKSLAVVVTLNGATAVNVSVGGIVEDSIRNIENIFGGLGRDTLTGDALSNVFRGGAGNDTLNGNSGSDTADYSEKSSAVAVTLNGSNSVSVRVGGIVEDGIRNIENIVGGSGNDTFTGDSLANVFKGGAGNDTLNGGTGIDTADYSDKTDAVRVTLNTSTAASVYVNEVVEDSVRNIENIIGGSAADTLTGDSLANVFKGGAGNDTLNGGTGVDTADYTDKTDAVRVTLNGSTTAIVYVNENAQDSINNIENIIGGSGNDTLTGDSLGNSLTGGDGNDTLKGAGGVDTLNGGAGVDTADFSDQTAAVVATLNGSTQITVTIGGSSNDRLSNIENLIGGSGADTLTGDSLANILSGGNGADRLSGGAGNDVLNGSAGADRFSFTTTLNASTNLDTIEDFVSLTDKIGLRSTIFARFSTSVGSGNLVVNSTGNAVDSNDYLIFNTSNSTLYYDADGNGAGAKIAFAVLTGVTTLTNTDFVIV